jgi:hypothetical protein
VFQEVEHMFPTFHRFEHKREPSRVSSRLIALTVSVAMLHMLVLVPAALAQNFGDWTPTVSIDPGRINDVNSFRNDGCPIEAPDAGTLFFASDRDPNGPPDAPAKDLDIWFASWDAAHGQWTNAEPLPSSPSGVNTGAMEFCPTPLPGNQLLFVSTRPGPCGANPNIYYTKLVMHPRPMWRTPVPLPCGAASINSAAQEFSPSLVQAEGRTLLFFSSNRNTGTPAHKIFVTELLADGTWIDAQEVTELTLPGASDARPNVRKDGLEIVFDSNRYGSFDIFTSTRASLDDPWSSPMALGSDINDPSADETRASLSRDGTRLYFGSTRANAVLGGTGADIYVSTRSGPGLRRGQ